MKRLRLWLQELSLYQQLISIIFVVSVAFTFFLFAFLMTSLNQFVELEMYKTIHRSQENVSFYFENGFSSSEISEHIDPNTSHFLYDRSQRIYYHVGSSQLGQDEAYSVLNNLDIEEGGVIDSVYLKGNLKIMYSVKDIGEGMYLISMISTDYFSQYRETLVDNVVNLNLTIVSFLFLLLMLWMGTVIHPLKQIRNYIRKIQMDEEATLKIDRRDEIGAVASALVEMKQELEDQKNLREEMIQNISHDLKTPIATIKSYGESIKDGIYPYETLEKSVDVIIEHASRLEKKVYSLITLNKMDYILEKEVESVNLKEVVEKVILSLKVIRPKIEITADLDEVFFQGQEEPWRIVIENLLDNALRYAKTRIKIELKEKNFSIYNDGPLIERDHLNKLFNAYEKGTEGQFGLGLSIVRRVCKGYGYLVGVDNLNDGVIFWVKDPRKKAKKTNKKISMS